VSERRSFIAAGLFLLPFLAVGVWVEAMAVQALFRSETARSATLFGFGLAFLALPLLLGGIGWNTWTRKRGIERLKTLAPNEPWLWDPEWREGRIESGGASTLIGIWAFAIVWNAIALPMIILLWDQLTGAEEAGIYVVLLFPLVGVGMLGYALYLSWRRYVYGVPLFILDRVPGVLGGTLSGRIALRVEFLPDAQVSLRLSCVRRVTTGSGKSRSTREEILWQNERKAHPSAGGGIPVRFTLPVDLPPSSPEPAASSILWRLEASMEVPGVDFAATFLLPVFATQESSAALTESALREQTLRFAGGTGVPVDAGIVVRRSAGGGKEYLLSAGRNISTGVGSGIVAVVLLGLVAALVVAGAPTLFPVIVGIFSLVLLYGLLQMSFGETAFVIEEGTLAIRHSLFTIMSLRRIPCPDVERVTVREGGQAGSARFHAIAVVRKGGGEIRTMGAIRSRQHAEWLASEIERSCRGAGAPAALAERGDVTPPSTRP
jgi:hypothetical protein